MTGRNSGVRTVANILLGFLLGMCAAHWQHVALHRGSGAPLTLILVGFGLLLCTLLLTAAYGTVLAWRSERSRKEELALAERLQRESAE